MAMRRPKRKSGAPLDPCDPPEMVTILLNRLKDSQLDESKKALLCAELNDLMWYFEKHPESVGMFRSDMLEWRTFLKQSKAYMDDMFENKMARTKQILDYLMGKPKSVQRKVVREPPQPSYYQILYRPGIRSIRQYPINEEHYGEHNKTIDVLHKQIATMREEIIYAPLTKISRASKNVFLDMLLSITEICAYDVLDGVGFVKEMEVLVNSIVEGEEYREKTNIVGYMSSLTSKLRERAKCHWKQGNGLRRKMWDDIASIEETFELMNKPKFDLDLLSKSDFLKREKMNEVAEISIETIEGDIVANKKDEKGPERTEVLKDESCCSESFYDITSVVSLPKLETTPHEERGCESAEYRQKDKIKQHSTSDSLACDGSSSGDVCSSQKQPNSKYLKFQPEKTVTSTSPVMDWANNIIATYGEPRQSVSTDEDIGEIKAPQYVPDVQFEEETIFKSKAQPKSQYGVLKHVVIPPPPDDTDANTNLIDIMRVELEDVEEEQNRGSLEHRLSGNPFLARRRLLKY